MLVHPTHMTRTPYLFHFEGQTVALGDPKFLYQINELLLKAKQPTRPTFWDQAYLANAMEEMPELAHSGVNEFGAANDYSLLNSVGTSLDEESFWQAIEKGVFAGASWPLGNAPLYLPELPAWLQNARSWEFDPVAPPDGPGALGAWTRVRGRTGKGQPIGLFQLTDAESFWVFGSADDLDSVMNLCRELSGVRLGFDQATGYFDETARYSCIALPVDCRRPMEEELFIAGVDCESLFWEES